MTQQMLSSHQTTRERRQQTVARVLGAHSFAAIPWRHLLKDGAFVELHIRRCGFTARLTPEDIGMQIDDDATRQTLARWVTLGEKRLLPEASMRDLSRIESRARSVLKDHAFRSELGFFVPITAYESWRLHTENLQAEYYALRDTLLTNYPELVRQVLAEYAVIAADTYQRLRFSHPNLVQEGQQHFVATYTNRIASQMPSPEKIRSSFAFRFYRVRGTQPLSEPAEESFPEGRATAVGEMRAETDQRTRQRAILENDLRQDAHQRVNAMLDEWLTTIVGHLRALVCEAAEDVLATLKRRGGERFSGRSTMQLNNLITQIRSLNFFGDAEMDQMMARVEQIVSLSPAERQRSLGDIQRTLRAIATTTRATLLDLDEHPRAPRADLGVAAIPSPQLVHAARAELHLPPLDPAHMASLEPSTRVSRAELGSLNAPLWRFAEQEAPAARGARTL